MHGQRSRLPVPKRIAEAPRGAGGSLIMPTWSAAGAPPSGVACLRTLRHTRSRRGAGLEAIESLGSVWVPTAELLLRIDTSRLPASRASSRGDRALW